MSVKEYRFLKRGSSPELRDFDKTTKLDMEECLMLENIMMKTIKDESKQNASRLHLPLSLKALKRPKEYKYVGQPKKQLRDYHS